MCGADFEETSRIESDSAVQADSSPPRIGGKVVCSVCKYAALPADAAINIEPEEVKALLDEKKILLIDVRTIQERMMAQITDSELVPIHEITERIGEITKDKPIVTYCHHGIRSFHAAAFLKQNGFNARSLKGGIEAWADRIDPKVGRY